MLAFPEAEIAKLTLTKGQPVSIKHILGFEQLVPVDLLIDEISPTTDKLATSIAVQIK